MTINSDENLFLASEVQRYCNGTATEVPEF